MNTIKWNQTPLSDYKCKEFLFLCSFDFTQKIKFFVIVNIIFYCHETFCKEIIRCTWLAFANLYIDLNNFYLHSIVPSYWFLIFSSAKPWALHEHLLSASENLIRTATNVALITPFSVNYSELRNPDYSRRYH